MSEIHGCPCASECDLEKALSWIGGKWKLRIICSLLADGSSRYNELLKRTHGISSTMLSQTLKELEKDQMIQREEYLEVPVRVEYSLTAKGRDLAPILAQLIQWSRGQLERADSKV